MTRRIAAVLLAAHGLIHLIGFVVPWGIAQVEGFPYRTTVLGGALALGDTGARAVGVTWLLLAVGFVVAGIATWRAAAWSRALTAVLAVASIGVCALGMPEAAFGIVINLVILAALAWATARRRASTPPIGRRVRGEA